MKRILGLSTLAIVVLIVLILLFAGAPLGVYPGGWGYWPGGLLGLLLIVVLVLIILGRL
jgi:hypothetical protein